MATPPPVAPPSFVSAPSQVVRVSKTRWGRRARRHDSSYLALMFLIGAAFLLLSVVTIIVIVLFL